MQMDIRNPNDLPVIDYREVKALQGDLKDPRSHDKLLKVLLKRGFDIPLFLWFDKSGAAWLMDGHQRQAVMTENDLNNKGSYEVPYIRIEAPSKKAAMAKLLEITSQYGTVTVEGLEKYLQAAELPVAETMELVSFDALDVGAGDGSDSDEEDEGESDDDETPEPDTKAPPKSKPGTIYQLGPHRLLCGDATDLGGVSELMDGKLADLIFTDPPYNVEYVGKTKDALTIQNDKQSDGDFYQFLLDSFTTMAMVTREGGGIYICHADSEGLNFRKAMIDAGFLLKQCIIWNKNSMVMGRQDYQWKHEPILYGWKEGAAHYFTPERNHTTVWDVSRPSRSTDHPTMKPVDLIKIAIRNSSKKGQLVLDLFGGSGSTMSAAHAMGRICYTAELDPVYCDVIRRRYAQLVEEEDWVAATPEVAS
jgi:DNA modification methylase